MHPKIKEIKEALFEMVTGEKPDPVMIAKKDIVDWKLQEYFTDTIQPEATRIHAISAAIATKTGQFPEKEKVEKIIQRFSQQEEMPQPMS